MSKIPLTIQTLIDARNLLMNKPKTKPVHKASNEPETFGCPLCNKPMQEGRAGMWLHYLEEGCDFVAALRRIQRFFTPMARRSAWADLGSLPQGTGSGVAEGRLRLHMDAHDEPPWETIEAVLWGRHPFKVERTGCGCESCRVIIQTSERGQIKKFPWGQRPTARRDHREDAIQYAFATRGVSIKSQKSAMAAMQDLGKPLKKEIMTAWVNEAIGLKVEDIT